MVHGIDHVDNIDFPKDQIGIVLDRLLVILDRWLYFDERIWRSIVVVCQHNNTTNRERASSR